MTSNAQIGIAQNVLVQAKPYISSPKFLLSLLL